MLLRLSGPPHDGTLCSSLDVPRKVHPWPLNLSPDTVRFVDQVERDSVLVTVIDCAAGMGEGIQLTAREPQNDTPGPFCTFNSISTLNFYNLNFQK